MKIQTVGLFGKFNDASISGIVADICGLLERHGIRVLLGDTTAPEIGGERIDDQGRPLGELIDLWTWIGAGVIFASSVAVMRQEAAERKLP